MGGKAELVKRRNLIDAEAALDEDARVAGERRRVAGDGDDERQGARGDLMRLRLRARARRIDEGAVERRQLFGSQRAPEEIARFRDEPVQALRRPARSSA